MSKTEIIAELSRLSVADLAEVSAKIDEIAGKRWIEQAELSDADRQALDQTLTAYEASPDAGSTWDEARARIQSRLRS
jgi:hypothetical protein